LKRDPDRKVYIYSLNDPDTNEVRYIGWCFDLKKRYSSHIYESSHPESSNSPDSHKNRWIRTLLAADKKPVIKIVDETVYKNHEEKEKYWIKYYKDLGCKLTNMTDGGYHWLNSENKLSDEEWSIFSEKRKMYYVLLYDLKKGINNYVESVYGENINNIDENTTLIKINPLDLDIEIFDFDDEQIFTIKEYRQIIKKIKNPYKNMPEDEFYDYYDDYLCDIEDDRNYKDELKIAKEKEKSKLKTKPKNKTKNNKPPYNRSRRII
jgi:hypothetical protein